MDASAEALTRKVIDRCGSCGHCRELLEDASCLFLPRLFRLYERETGGGAAISSAEMRQMLDLCNTCGICPCPPIRAGIREAKDAFVAREGLPLTTRVLEDVRLACRLGCAMPRLANAVMGVAPVARAFKRVAGLHPERKLPRFPRQSFDGWARARGLTQMPRETTGRKVAYFAGCTARYLFPEVAQATVEVLQHNGVTVYVPPQKCCGMPPMLEGDRPFTFSLARANVAELGRCVAEGFDIVCSCPTCGYFFKSVLPEGAEFAPDFRALVTRLLQQSKRNMAQVSERLAEADAAFTGRMNRRSAVAREPWKLSLTQHAAFRDEGYLAELPGIERLRVAHHTYDLGEYLLGLRDEGALRSPVREVTGRHAYYAPCHQREQGIGTPWMELLAGVPGLAVERVGNSFDCCGLAGIMGFKRDFHRTSVAIGRRLAQKVAAAAPDRVVTECLSCRMQFQQLLGCEVVHPVEILRQACAAA